MILVKIPRVLFNPNVITIEVGFIASFTVNNGYEYDLDEFRFFFEDGDMAIITRFLMRYFEKEVDKISIVTDIEANQNNQANKNTL